MVRVCFLLIVLIAAGCGYDKADIGVETPPLQVSESGTYPVDSTQFYFDPDGLPLVVRFKREFGPGEVSHLQLVPTPLEVGQVLNPSEIAKELRIESVVLDTIYPAYRLVLDGPDMLRPEVISYYSGVKSAKEGGVQGSVLISRGKTKPEDALVYALVPPGLEHLYPLTGAEETLLGRPILGVTNTVLLQIQGVEVGWFRLAGLENWRRYIVVAILDTTGDGEYVLEEDWWGYYRDEVDAPLEVTAGVSLGSQLEPPLPEMRLDIDFWLREPGALDPNFEP